MTSAHPILVCGIGPGHSSLILPAVNQALQTATVVVGGKRHLELFSLYGKERITIGRDITSVLDKIDQLHYERIVVLVSGDTGYHSFLRTIKKHLPHRPVQAIPGISSYQYLYARLGLTYEEAYLGSVHGTDCTIEELPTHYESYFFLTDTKITYQHLAQRFQKLGRGQWLMHVGSRLSYPNEVLQSANVDFFTNLDHELPLCSVIIERNTNGLTR